MTAQVASPGRLDSLDKVPGSRRSILANMGATSPPIVREAPATPKSTANEGLRPASGSEEAAAPVDGDDSELNVPLGKTDSLLRSRTKGSPAVSSLRRGSVQDRKSASPASVSPPTSPPSTASALLSEVANGGYNGSTRKNGRPHRAQSVPVEQAPRLGGSNDSSTGGSGSIHRLRRRLSNLSQSTTNKADDDDRASLSSNLSSHRDAISGFLRRARSRSSSKEPESVPDSASISNGSMGRRRTLSGSVRRMSLKIPGRTRKRSESAGDAGRFDDDDAPPVPALPQARRTNSSVTSGTSDSAIRSSAPDGYPSAVAAPTAGPDKKTTTKAYGARKQTRGADIQKDTTRAASNDVEGTTAGSQTKTNVAPQSSQKEQQPRSYVGAATAAVASAGAAVGGTAAALMSKVTTSNADDGYESESDDDDDVFHDAELADIHEDDEDDAEEAAETSATPSQNGRALSHTKSSPQSQPANRAKGVGAAAVTQEPSPRSDDAKKDAANGDAAGDVAAVGLSAAASPAPSRLKGTSGARRRAGTQPEQASTVAHDQNDAEDKAGGGTPQDTKARKEVPHDVREKAARVSRLRFEDVDQSTDEMYEDISVARGALHLFLNSRMIEAEDIIKEHADKRMYYALGYGIIATMKGFMTFEPEDLATAISYCKDSMTIAHHLRKQSNAVANLGRFVRGTGHGPAAMASMTLVQRHAELVYAESLLLKAVLGIVYSGDFFGFVAEALNMRNAYGSYRSLAKYVETADAKAPGRHDKSIDEDFRSGVLLGNGLISLILGLLPGKILKVMDVFGYSGDTRAGLETLMKAGGWVQNASQKKPKVDIDNEGIRRPVCDMGILLFHLVISVFVPVSGVDIQFADRVLHYHLDRYPRGVFFLYFSGRLYSTQALCERAVKQYTAARDAQQEYVQLQHISWWDASLCHMSLAQWAKARECFEVLLKESNWSKAVYSYGVAANILQDEPESEKAASLLNKVPGLMQRIAGKSIPLEKFVARKAHKFNTQGRLLLPAIEFSYIYHCLSNAPRYALMDEQLVMISEALTELNEVEDPSQYHSGADEYWDDFCLAHFLRGVTLKYIAHPEPHAKVDPPESDIPIAEAEEQALLSFNTVLEHGHKIANDFWYIYFSHYELGRLHANMGNDSEAKRELDLVLSGKMLEDKGNRSGKHKYSMQNMALLRSNGALNALTQK
ncbi:unnamed protein product [Parajaminaea phylloscopi]